MLHSLAFFGSIGGPELLVIALIALLLFGVRLPKVARSIGQSVNEFKAGLKEGQTADPEADETGKKGA